MNDIFWPDDLASREAEQSAALAEDAGHPSPPMPHEVGSDDIEVVRASIAQWEGRADYAAQVIVALENQLDELEARASFAERREERRDYYSRVI